MRRAASFHLFFPVCAALLGGCGSDGNDTAASDEMPRCRPSGDQQRQAVQRAAAGAGHRAAAGARVAMLHRAAGTRQAAAEVAVHQSLISTRAAPTQQAAARPVAE